MQATKIRMKAANSKSQELTEIDQIYIVGNVYFNTGWYPPAFLHDYVKASPGSLQANQPPYPSLMPATGNKNEKYIKTEPDSSGRDILLKLPRE